MNYMWLLTAAISSFLSAPLQSTGLQAHSVSPVSSKTEYRLASSHNNSISYNKSKEDYDNSHDEQAQSRVKRRLRTSNKLPEFSAPIGNVTAVLGRDVRMVCTVENLGQYQIAWLKEETKTIISIDTNIIITNYRIFLIPDEEERKWVLHIKDVQESDRGFYQCQVNTSPMRATSGYLEVVVPPTIIESQTSQVAEVAEHSNVSIQCKASGHPAATISWRRDDGLPIKLNGRSQVDTFEQGGPDPSSTLVQTAFFKIPNDVPATVMPELADIKSDRLSLYNVDRSMAGIYVCTASNGLPGQASKRIPVYVKFAPKTSVQNKYISVSLGDQLEIDCLIEAFPKANSYWSKKSSHRPEFEVETRRLARNGAQRANLAKQPKSQIFLAKQLANNELVADDQQLDSLGWTRNRSSSPVTRFSWPIEAHPHNRISVRQADHRLANDGIAAELPTRWPSPVSRDSLDGIRRPPRQSATNRAFQGSQPLVTVKQTALNSYTYKLHLTIAKLNNDDYGQYTCISSNSMGTSESQVIITKADKQADGESRSRPDGSRPSEDGEYQRDSLEYIRQTQFQTESRRNSTGGNRVVYDENYLQAIKSRLNNNNNNFVGPNKLHQKLKLRQSSDKNSTITNPSPSILLVIAGLAAIVGTLAGHATDWRVR